MVFVLSVLNSVHDLCESVLIINKGIVLNRVCILGIFCHRHGRDFSGSPIPKYWSSTPPGYPADVIYPRLVFEAALRPPEVRVEIPFNLIGK